MQAFTKFILIFLCLLGCSNLAFAQQFSKETHESIAAANSLRKYLKYNLTRDSIAKREFMKVPLDKNDADYAADLIWTDQVAAAKKQYATAWKNKILTFEKFKMPFDYKIFGTKPKDGHSLYISMHGGGGTTPEVNDQQWENQKKLYKLDEGIYLAPRAPTNEWNLWHQDNIDVLFADLIQAAVALENINLNKVYVIGYSAGGDGVYQLAPRMADYWAGAGMFAGHPNETSPLGLRNVPFALWVGELDDAYDRNKIAGEWKVKLSDLRKKDTLGYVNQVVIPKGKGHWMDFEEKAALPWLATFTRNPIPNKVVWKQDDVLHTHFYWLGVPKDLEKKGDEIVASYKDQSIYLEQLPEQEEVIIYLNDAMMDLDEPVFIYWKGTLVQELKPKRTIATIWETTKERKDKHLAFSVKIHFQKGKIIE